MFTASRIYLSPPPAKPPATAVLWLCEGAPGRAECNSCVRRKLLAGCAPGSVRTLQPWTGHGPCPDHQPSTPPGPEKPARSEQ